MQPVLYTQLLVSSRTGFPLRVKLASNEAVERPLNALKETTACAVVAGQSSLIVEAGKLSCEGPEYVQS